MKTVITATFKTNNSVKLYSNITSFVKHQRFKKYNAQTIRNRMSLKNGIFEDKYISLCRVDVIE